MKSIKPGRGPSMMGGVFSIVAAVFGVVWTLAAVNMGAPPFFALFGIVFVILGIVQAVYNFKNAVGKKRFSSFDITDGDEEGDPLDERFGNPERGGPSDDSGEAGSYCPYCGAKVGPEFEFCRRCGRKL